MKNKIIEVYSDSLAEEVGIEVGDMLLKINDKEVKDIIDYRFLMADEEITVEVQKSDGEVWEIEIEKDFSEDLGVEFEEAILDKARSCTNKCVFCFIDQLPKGMRETLYFKDDDSRLAFLQGNFVTLTNMSEEDIERIINYRISPINVSVHTTNPELRVKMLNNRFAGAIYDRLKRFAEAGISMNCQIVLCPGLNNGNELVRTVQDLYKLYPAIGHVAAVPVGVTRYREGLHPISLYTRETAVEELALVSKLQKRFIKEITHPFIRLSDEFYILAGQEIPDSDFYHGFEQLEDGIGMIRLFRDNIQASLPELKKSAVGSFTAVTGVSAYEEIQRAADIIMKNSPKIKLDVVKVINNYFGETITVAGLITGHDILERLSKADLGEYIIIPTNMLKRGYESGPDLEQVFLDDVTIEEMEKTLKRKVLICEYTGEDFIDIINQYTK